MEANKQTPTQFVSVKSIEIYDILIPVKCLVQVTRKFQLMKINEKIL
jgi:hypothetical protein